MNILDKLRKKSSKWFLIPLICGLLIVLCFGVNVIYWDEWENVRIYYYFADNGIDLNRLWQPHNEHRLFFPNILILFTAFLTGWNVKIQMVLSVFFLFAIYMLIVSYVSEKTGGENNTFHDLIAILTLAGILLFSPIQSENLLMGFQSGYYLAMLLSVIAMLTFSKYIESGKKRLLAVSLTLAVCATFSGLNFVSLWPAYVILIIALMINNRSIKHGVLIGVILAVAVITAGVFLTGYNIDSIKTAGSFSFERIKASFVFFLNAIGSAAFFAEPYASIFMGSLILITFLIISAVTVIFRKINKVMFPMFIAATNFGSLMIISFGRGALTGATSAVSSRYTSHSLMIIVSTAIMFCVLISNIADVKIKLETKTGYVSGITVKIKYMKYMIITVFCGMILCSWISGLYLCDRFHEDRITAQKILYNYDKVPLSYIQKYVYPCWDKYDWAYSEIERLKNDNASVFSSDKLNDADTSDIIFDQVDISGYNRYECDEMTNGLTADAITIDDNFITIENTWVIDPYSGTGYGDVYIKVNGRCFETESKIYRPDVAAFFGNDEYMYSGIRTAIPLSEVECSGNVYNINAVVIQGNGTDFFETPVITISI